MKLLTGIISVLLMLLLSACGQKSGTKLNVSASFAIGGDSFPGGLIAYGQGPNGQKFQLTSGNSKTVSIVLPDGQWKIMMVGWDNGDSEKFIGEKYCGIRNIELNSSISDISVSMDQANCEVPELVSALAFDTPAINTCSAFYDYDEVTNAWDEVDETTDPWFCDRLPRSVSENYPFYKLVYNDLVNGVISPGVASSCQEAYTEEPTLGLTSFEMMPTKTMPLTLKFYKSEADCLDSTSTRFVKYDFPNGLQAGNPGTFDNLYIDMPDGVKWTILASSFTKRGKSPFVMDNMIPSMSCGPMGSFGGCFEEPMPETPNFYPADLRVEWEEYSRSGDDDLPILFRDVVKLSIPDGTSCSTASPVTSDIFDILNDKTNNPYFNLSACEVRKGNVAVKFERNQFTCRGDNDFQGVIKMYEKGGKVFIAHEITGPPNKYYINIYNTSGKLLTRVDTPDDDTIESMMTDNSGNLWVLVGSGPKYIKKYTASSSFKTSVTYTGSFLASVKHIEWHTNGTINNLVLATSTTLYAVPSTSIPVSFPSAPSTNVSIAGAVNIKKVLSKLGRLYLLSEISGATQSDEFFVTNISSDSIAVPTSLFTDTDIGERPKSFHITTYSGRNYLHLLPLDGFGLGNVKLIDVNGSLTDHPNMGNALEATTPDGIDMIAFGNKVFNLQEHISAPVAPTVIFKEFDPVDPADQDTWSLQYLIDNSATLDICESSFDFSSIPAISYMGITDIRVESHSTSDFYQLFNDLYRYVGRGQAFAPGPNVVTYFEALNKDKDGDVRSGGIMSNVQEMLGPGGIGGILHELYPGKNCAEIRTALPSGGRTVSKTFSEPFGTKRRTYSMTIDKAAVPMDIVDDSYNLTFNLTSTDDVNDVEKMFIKLKCNIRRGSIENYDFRSGDERRRELTIWDFDKLDENKFDRYIYEEKLNSNNAITKKRSEVIGFRRIAGTDFDFSLRNISIELQNSLYNAWASEIHRDSANAAYLTIHHGISGISDANFAATTQFNGNSFTNSTFSTSMSSDAIETDAHACMDEVDTSTSAPDIGPCALPSTFTSESWLRNVSRTFTPNNVKSMMGNPMLIFRITP